MGVAKTVLRTLAAAALAAACAHPAAALAQGDGETDYNQPQYIKQVEIIRFQSARVKIGSGAAGYVAVVRLADGSVASGGNAEVIWSVVGPDGKPNDKVLFPPEGYALDGPAHSMDPETGRVTDLEGCSATFFWVPYGEPAGFYTLVAMPRVRPNDPSLTDTYNILVDYASEDNKTFYHFSPGSVSVGSVSGQPPSFGESYDKDDRAYSVRLPECAWCSDCYRFAGWRDAEGVVRKPGVKVTVPRAAGRWGLTAVWEPKFQFPRLFRAEARGIGVKLSWRRVIGGGYTIYRAAPGKKFRKVKTVSGDAKTSWTDKRVKSGKTYRYKIAAWKAEGGKRVSTAKGYAIKAAAGGRARANARKVTVSKASVAGKVGGKARLKAKVAAKGGKAPLSKKVRWYSSDESVARVGKSTGKVTLLSKGRCTIWAKAHDGINSKRVAVTVR